ncbi:ABC transporter permease [Ruminococcus gauvreauii]|uniref:ABC transporter permease n=1 Tax=Ruminococcus gauvreauii TaxID=438033 RepID=UPI0039844E90
MKTIHGNKLAVIMEMKAKALFSKNFIIMPVFAIGFTFIMKLIYGSIAGSGGMNDQLKGMALSYGALMNITMTGIYCVSAALAEEKEKHTLRALMTSSVNGLEFFLGSLIPVIAMVTVVNAVLVPVVGFRMNGVQWAVYISVSLLAAVASGVIGMIFGIFAKNQITAGTLTTPALLVLMMIPMFSGLNAALGKISDFLFTGVMVQIVENMASGSEKLVNASSIIVIVTEIIAAVVCFLVIYRRNGYDSE